MNYYKIKPFTMLFYIAILLCLSCTSDDEKFSFIDDLGDEINNTHSIIPYPEKVEYGNSIFELSESISIDQNEENKSAIRVIREYLEKEGLLVDVSSNTSNADIFFSNDSQLEDEEYRIEIDSDKIHIVSNSERGAFYASQSLIQYFWTAEKEKNNIKVPTVVINDKPDSEYRSFMLDISRHFFSKEYILKLIDELALYKINKLQLHLTDDQGWRIEIDKYPKLTEVGAYRNINDLDIDREAMEKAKRDPDYDFTPEFLNGEEYGGFLTKEEIREIINYAEERFVEIIPEIDMPGHMTAAMRAYPWLSCDGTTDWGDEFSKPMCVCDPQVLEFAKDIWDEIIELFPSDRVHIGADEVDKSFWKNSQKCQNFMSDNDMSSVDEIEGYFVREMAQYLEGKGKTVTAWDDVLVNNDSEIKKRDIPSSIDLTFWRDYQLNALQYAGENGNQVILTPWTWFYLGFNNSDEHLLNLYEFDESEELSTFNTQTKLGYQISVFTEDLPSEAAFEKFVFPFLQAFAEVAWTKRRDVDVFKKQLEVHLDKMKQKNINYKRPDFMN